MTHAADAFEKSKSLNWFERWFLRRVCDKLVTQGPKHNKRIQSYYRIMYEAARAEFTEDNVVTTNGYLAEWHKAACD